MPPRSLADVLGKLRRVSAEELVDRTRQRITGTARRLLPLPAATVVPDAHLSPRTPWPVDPAIVRSIAVDAGPYSAVLRTANELLAGDARLNAGVRVRLDDAHDWQRDPISGRVAPFAWFTTVPFLDANVVGDHKATWELSRLQWLLPLAQAYRLTGDPRYVEHAQRLLESWWAKNPVYRGINWTSALEAAFRVVAQTFFLHTCVSAGAGLPLPFVRRLVAQVEAHARYIDEQLSTWFAPNTHLTGEALALLIAGTAWPDLRGAARWRTTGWEILAREALRQLREDGSYFEQSSWYQHYTVDFYLEAMRWGALTGNDFPPAVHDRIRHSAALLGALIRPDGSFVSLGDDDGGTLWPLTGDACGVAQRTVAAAAAQYGPAMGDDQSPRDPTAVASLRWLYAPADVARAEQRPARRSDERFPRARLFAAGGIVVITDVGPDAGPDVGPSELLVLDAGPHGTYGHSHDDALTVDLSVGGVPLISDPGTASYMDAAIRARYRDGSTHAVVTTPLLKRAVPNGPFAWSARVESRVIDHGWSNGLAWVAAAVGECSADAAEHRRLVVRLRARCWLVLDEVVTTNAATHDITIRWPLGSGIDVERVGERCLLRRHGHDVGTLLIGGASWAAVPARRSPTYGVEIDALRVEAQSTFAREGMWLTAITDAASDATLQQVRAGRWVYRDRLGDVWLERRGVDGHTPTWMIAVPTTSDTALMWQPLRSG